MGLDDGRSRWSPGVVAALGCLLLVSSAHAQVCGDADGDGQVSVTDGVNVLRAAAGLSGNCPRAECDVDGNGIVTVTDGVIVLRAAAGLPVTLACAPEASRPGDLDEDFGNQGTVTVGPQGDLELPRHGLRLLPGGAVETIVLVHRTSQPTILRIIQVRADGTHAEVASTASSLADVDAEDAAFAANGDVWVAGRSVIARFGRTADGALADASRVPTSIMSVADLVPTLDDGILIVGEATQASGLQRFDAAVRPDANFGSDDRLPDGLVLGPARPNDVDETSTVFGIAAVAGNGRILTAATQFAGLGFFPVVFAYDQQGKLDPTFGSAGVASLGVVGNATAITADDAGATFVATIGSETGLRHVTADGRLDPAYAGAIEGGAASLAVGSEGDVTAVGAIFVPDEPRRLDCGNSSGGVCLRLALSVQRFLPGGGPDLRFGVQGTVVTDTAPPYGAQGTELTTFVPAPDRRITAAGLMCVAAFACDLVVTRYVDVD